MGGKWYSDIELSIKWGLCLELLRLAERETLMLFVSNGCLSCALQVSIGLFSSSLSMFVIGVRYEVQNVAYYILNACNLRIRLKMTKYHSQ